MTQHVSSHSVRFKTYVTSTSSQVHNNLYVCNVLKLHKPMVQHLHWGLDSCSDDQEITRCYGTRRLIVNNTETRHCTLWWASSYLCSHGQFIQDTFRYYSSVYFILPRGVSIIFHVYRKFKRISWYFVSVQCLTKCVAHLREVGATVSMSLTKRQNFAEDFDTYKWSLTSI